MARWPFARRRDTPPAGVAASAPAVPAPVPPAAAPEVPGAGLGRVRRPAWVRLPPLHTTSSARAPATMELSDFPLAINAPLAAPLVGPPARPVAAGLATGRVTGLLRPVTELPEPEPEAGTMPDIHRAARVLPVRPSAEAVTPDPAPLVGTPLVGTPLVEAPLVEATGPYVLEPRVPDEPWRPSEFMHRASIEKDRFLAQAKAQEAGVRPEPSPPPAPASAPEPPPQYATLGRRTIQRASLATSRRQGIGLHPATQPLPAADPHPDRTTPDAASLDAAMPDVAPLDAVTPDVTTADAASPGAITPDAAMLDVATVDAATLDGATVDAAPPGAVTPDAAMPDGAAVDAATLDAATVDAVPPDAVTPDAAMPDGSSPEPDGRVSTHGTPGGAASDSGGARPGTGSGGAAPAGHAASSHASPDDTTFALAMPVARGEAAFGHPQAAPGHVKCDPDSAFGGDPAPGDRATGPVRGEPQPRHPQAAEAGPAGAGAVEPGQPGPAGEATPAEPPEPAAYSGGVRPGLQAPSQRLSGWQRLAAGHPRAERSPAMRPRRPQQSAAERSAHPAPRLSRANTSGQDPLADPPPPSGGVPAQVSDRTVGSGMSGRVRALGGQPPGEGSDRELERGPRAALRELPPGSDDRGDDLALRHALVARHPRAAGQEASAVPTDLEPAVHRAPGAVAGEPQEAARGAARTGREIVSDASPQAADRPGATAPGPAPANADASGPAGLTSWAGRQTAAARSADGTWASHGSPGGSWDAHVSAADPGTAELNAAGPEWSSDTRASHYSSIDSRDAHVPIADPAGRAGDNTPGAEPAGMSAVAAHHAPGRGPASRSGPDAGVAGPAAWTDQHAGGAALATSSGNAAVRADHDAREAGLIARTGQGPTGGLPGLVHRTDGGAGRRTAWASDDVMPGAVMAGDTSVAGDAGAAVLDAGGAGLAGGDAGAAGLAGLAVWASGLAADRAATVTGEAHLSAAELESGAAGVGPDSLTGPETAGVDTASGSGWPRTAGVDTASGLGWLRTAGVDTAGSSSGWPSTVGTGAAGSGSDWASAVKAGLGWGGTGVAGGAGLGADGGGTAGETGLGAGSAGVAGEVGPGSGGGGAGSGGVSPLRLRRDHHEGQGPLGFRGRPGGGGAALVQRVPAGVASRVGAIHSIDVSDAMVRRGPVVSARARELGARGYTHGGVVHLPDAVGPLDTREGGALLAHELTHVAQQRRWGDALPSADSPQGLALEAEAQAVEQWFADGHPGPPPSPEPGLELEHPKRGTVVESWSAPAGLHHRTPPVPAPAPALQLAPAPWSRADIAAALSGVVGSARERAAGMWDEFHAGYRSAREQPEPDQRSLSELWEDGRARMLEAYDEFTGGVSRGYEATDNGAPPGLTTPTGSGAGAEPSAPVPTQAEELTEAKVADLMADDPPRRWMDLDADEDIDELALRLYDRIVTRLRFDVLVQRERSGTLLDFG